MLRKFLLCFSAVLLFSGLNNFVVFAEENTEDTKLIEVVDETTLKNKEGEYYFFESQADRDDFLTEIMLDEISVYACLPGDPGYPTCTGKVVKKSELQTLSGAVNTGYLYSKNYLCGNGGWAFGPAQISYSGSASVAAQYTYKGSFSLSFSYTVTSGVTFNVPKDKRGNILYKANFKLTPKRYKYTFTDGSVSYGTKFYTRTLIAGGFALKLLPA